MAANVTPPKLSPNQRKAFETLTTTGSVSSASKAAGVSRQTIYRWLKEPAFAGMVREQEAQTLERVSGMLVAAASHAVAVLVQEMRDADSSASRIRAADAVLTKVLSLRELASIESRLTEIEKAVNYAQR